MLKSQLLAGAMLVTLGAGPVLAASPTAQDHRNDPAQRQEEPRVYDRAHRDYHAWNGDEDRRYREFQTMRHRKYREFSRLKKNQQNEYWQWRHQHDDR